MPFYPLQIGINPFDFKYLSNIVLLFSIICFSFYKFNRGFFVSLFYFLIVLAPVIGILQFGPQIMADRYSYQVAPLFSILLSVALLKLTNKKLCKFLSIILFVLISLFAKLTWEQSKIWKSDFQIWKHSLKILPDFSAALYNVGVGYERNNELDKAIQYYKRVLKVKEKYFFEPDRADVCARIGLLYERLGDIQQAIDFYNEALKIDTNHFLANMHLGEVFLNRKEFMKSIKYFTSALKYKNITEKEITQAKDKLSYAYYKYGVNLFISEKEEESVQAFKMSLQYNPKMANAHIYLGKIFINNKKIQKAKEEFKLALQIDENNIYALFNLASILSYEGNKKKSVNYLKRILEIDPKFPSARKLLLAITEKTNLN